MNSKTKHILHKLLVNDFVYTLFRPLLFIAERIKASRSYYLHADEYRTLHASAVKIFSGKTVCNGPFKGMIFTRKASNTGSTYAMLLGSFESEIHAHLYAADQAGYQQVINIGCADGYYAAGLARMIPSATIYAYDTDKKLLLAAQKTADDNNLGERVHFFGEFTARTIEKLDSAKRSFFIVDCEGAERQIFNRENVLLLRRADLIIEMHINIYPDLEEYFTGLFEDTHDIKIVDSVDDHIKAKTYSYPEINGLDYALRRFITEERAIFMQWIILTAKNPHC